MDRTIEGELTSDGSTLPQPPSLEQVRAASLRIAPYIVHTPVVRWRADTVRDVFGDGTEIWFKLEHYQIGGSFKARGALNAALQLPAKDRERGLTAFSSGNHAIAVAFAASVLGVSAKVVMVASANPARVEFCRRLGAEIVFAPDGEAAADLAEQIRRVEGRAVIHPYEGVQVSEATGTIALEIAQQVPDLDAIVLSVGGGGLCSGVSSTMKQLRPECRIYGVEPEGADTMYRSFRSGHVESLDSVATIADCLAPPRTLPYSFGLCRQFVDKLVLIDDDRIVGAMKTLFADLKIAAEPGGAASTAAALGPLRDRLAGKKSLILLCGSNIDLDTFTSILSP